MKLVFATNNKNKVKEINALLQGSSIEILTLEDIGCFEDIEETENTLQGNAKLKADYVSENYGFDCFADDTGLEVSALNGAPGVYSARYAGENGSAENNMQKLLRELNGIENRKAQFKTVIALNIKGKQHIFEGICEGDILYNKQGEEGFGYDPIFRPNDYNESFAEMSLEEKGEISHRGLAIKKLIYFLKNYKN